VTQKDDNEYLLNVCHCHVITLMPFTGHPVKGIKVIASDVHFDRF